MLEGSTVQDIALAAANGSVIAARLFAPAQRPTAVVLIAAAMGVKQDYYRDFAIWLARQGYAALTFDYRGMGASRPPAMRHSLRGFEADLFDWADDVDAAIERLAGVHLMRRCTSSATAWARNWRAC